MVFSILPHRQLVQYQPFEQCAKQLYSSTLSTHPRGKAVAKIRHHRRARSVCCCACHLCQHSQHDQGPSKTSVIYAQKSITGKGWHPVGWISRYERLTDPVTRSRQIIRPSWLVGLRTWERTTSLPGESCIDDVIREPPKWGICSFNE